VRGVGLPTFDCINACFNNEWRSQRRIMASVVASPFTKHINRKHARSTSVTSLPDLVLSLPRIPKTTWTV
jgi:hypothetical protein